MIPASKEVHSLLIEIANIECARGGTTVEGYNSQTLRAAQKAAEVVMPIFSQYFIRDSHA